MKSGLSAGCGRGLLFCRLRARNNEIKLETLSFRFPVSCFPVICFSCALLMHVPLVLSSHSWVLLVLRWWWWTASLCILLLAMLHQCHSLRGCRSLLFHRCPRAAAALKCTHTHRFGRGGAGQTLPGWLLWAGMVSSACWHSFSWKNADSFLLLLESLSRIWRIM